MCITTNYDLKTVYNNSLENPNNEEIDQLLTTLKNNKIIINGAGSAGQHISAVLKNLGIKTQGFVDNTKTGNILESNIYEYNIYNQLNEKEYIIILASNFLPVIEDMGKVVPDYFVKLNGYYLNKILSLKNCLNNYYKDKALNMEECFGCRADMAKCPAFKLYSRKTKKNALKSNYSVNLDAGGGGKLNDFTYCITKKCTLKCKHCIIKVPFVKQKNVPFEKVKNDLNLVSENVTFIDRFGIMGGELFLHPQIKEILEFVLQIKNFGFIQIYTNGNFIPSNVEDLLPLLKDKRISLNISDYGENINKKLYENTIKFCKILDNNNISYNKLSTKTWFDLDNFEQKNLSPEVKKNTFEKCQFTNCITMHDGIIYRCAYQMGGILTDKLEPLDIITEKDLKEKNIKLLDQFYLTTYIEACNHCNIQLDNVPIVPAAIQILKE